MLKKDNIKKNLLRVQQRANQGLGRAEKTEVLSEDLQNAERKVEVLRTVVQNLIKRLTASLQANGIQDTDKRAKKMPIVHLANSLQDNSTQLAEGVLSDVFSQCAMGLLSIGYAQQTYELIIEKSTLAYFQQLLDVDIPAIKKSKQILSKLTLDMDATRSRQQAASKESSHHPSTHNQSKSETLNNDLEDAEQKVAACKDQYATEMLTFISKESEICLRIVELMDAQLSYYRSSVTQLEDLLPEIKNMIGQHSTRPVYGCPLDEHLQTTGKEIATVIEACVSILYHEGLEEEGLFRIAGSASKLKKLKAAFNVGTLVDMDDYSDYHVVAGALKQYIRELPEPLLTFQLFGEFLQCMSIKERDARLQQLWTVVNKLPKTNFDNVKYLIKFLSKLAEKSDINKMSPGNIAIVFGPNLLWDPNDDGKPNVVLSAVQNQVVEILVTHHEYFFPGEFELLDSWVSSCYYNRQAVVAKDAGREAGEEVSCRPKLSHTRSSSMYVSSTSSAAETGSPCGSPHTTCDSTISQSTDTIGSDTLRRKAKGTRLSFPSALNSASDKLFGKRRSSESIKSKASANGEADRRDRKSFMERFGLKAASRERFADISRSHETGLDSTGLGTALDSPETSQCTAYSPIGQIEFKPAYLLGEERLDSWQTGAPDAPLATEEMEDTAIDPPKRSFPLCSTSLPYHVHNDMYNTAFALASLKGDGTTTGLEYLNRVHSVANTAFFSSANKPSSSHLCTQDIQLKRVTVYSRAVRRNAFKKLREGSTDSLISTEGPSNASSSQSTLSSLLGSTLAIARTPIATSSEPRSSSPSSPQSPLCGDNLDVEEQFLLTDD